MLGPAKTLAFSFCGLPNMDSSKQYNWSPQRKETKQIEKMPPRFMGNFLVLGLVILVLSPLFLPGLLVICFALSPPSLLSKTAKKGCKDEAKWERSSFELPLSMEAPAHSSVHVLCFVLLNRKLVSLSCWYPRIVLLTCGSIYVLSGTRRGNLLKACALQVEMFHLNPLIFLVKVSGTRIREEMLILK